MSIAEPQLQENDTTNAANDAVKVEQITNDSSSNEKEDKEEKDDHSQMVTKTSTNSNSNTPEETLPIMNGTTHGTTSNKKKDDEAHDEKNDETKEENSKHQPMTKNDKNTKNETSNKDSKNDEKDQDKEQDKDKNDEKGDCKDDSKEEDKSESDSDVLRIKSGDFVDTVIVQKLLQIPHESKIKFDDSDERMKEHIIKKYGNEINSFEFWPCNTITRYVVGYKHYKHEKDRIYYTLDKFGKYVKFHKEYYFDKILTMNEYNNKDFIENTLNKQLLVACPYFFYGLDYQGHPIFWDDGTGSAGIIHDVFSNSENGEVDSFKINLLRSITMRRMYNLKYKLSKYYNYLIFQHIIVINLENLGISEFTEQLTKNRAFHVQTTQELSDLFPEVVFQLYFINAPKAFRVIWKMISKFIDPLTVKKTKVLGKDYLKKMTKYIDINMIPKKYGGKGKWNIRYGNVPKNFPFQTDDCKLPKIEDIEKLTKSQS